MCQANLSQISNFQMDKQDTYLAQFFQHYDILIQFYFN